MQEKILCIAGRDTQELNKHLEDGWYIKQISACGSYAINCCYVHLIKENYENRNSNNS